jgi:hypothetical protein
VYTHFQEHFFYVFEQANASAVLGKEVTLARLMGLLCSFWCWSSGRQFASPLTHSHCQLPTSVMGPVIVTAWTIHGVDITDRDTDQVQWMAQERLFGAQSIVIVRCWHCLPAIEALHGWLAWQPFDPRCRWLHHGSLLGGGAQGH